MKYRIVIDGNQYFEAQFKPRWWPFWMQCFGFNTCSSIEIARQVCDRHFKEHAVKAKVEDYDPTWLSRPF